MKIFLLFLKKVLHQSTDYCLSWMFWLMSQMLCIMSEMLNVLCLVCRNVEHTFPMAASSGKTMLSPNLNVWNSFAMHSTITTLDTYWVCFTTLNNFRPSSAPGSELLSAFNLETSQPDKVASLLSLSLSLSWAFRWHCVNYSFCLLVHRLTPVQTVHCVIFMHFQSSINVENILHLEFYYFIY